MAANFTEIKARLDYYCDETVDPAMAIMLFNQCSEDIAHISGYAKTAETDFDKDIPMFTLPPDYFDMDEIKYKRASEDFYLRLRPLGLVQPSDIYSTDYPEKDGSDGFEIFGDQIEIRARQMESGKLQMRYYAYLPTIGSLDDVPLLKARFHDMYALYAVSKYFQNYMDEINTKNDYWHEYMTKRSELEQEFNRLRTRTRSKKVYQYRTWS